MVGQSGRKIKHDQSTLINGWKVLREQEWCNPEPGLGKAPLPAGV